MISRICICCGEPFALELDKAFENPNICLACSQMADEAGDELAWQLEGSPRARVLSFDDSSKNPSAS